MKNVVENTRPDIPLGYTRDSNGNELTYKSSTGYWCEYTRDSNGFVLTYKDSNGYWCEYTYDSNGLVLTHKDSTGYWCEYTRDSNGNELTYKDSEGERRRASMTAMELYELLNKAGIDYEVIEIFEGARFIRIEVEEAK